MRCSLFLAPAVLGLVAAPAVAAEPEITAVGPALHARSVSGPDVLGRYTLRVRIADLNPASDAGWQRMNRRVAMGTALLCDAAGTGPRYAGFHDSGQRACWNETRAAAQAQMIEARQKALTGRSLAFLDLSR